MHLYIVTRRDLSAGQQLAQVGHAAFQFSQQFPVNTKIWYQKSNYICILAVENETELQHLVNINACMSIVQEPDLDGAVTAIAFEPSPEVKNHLAGLNLAG